MLKIQSVNFFELALSAQHTKNKQFSENFFVRSKKICTKALAKESKPVYNRSRWSIYYMYANR